MKTYERSVLDVCSELHGSDTGSCWTIPDDVRGEMIEWLRWRVAESWHQNRDGYDSAVHALAVATLAMTDATDAARKDQP